MNKGIILYQLELNEIDKDLSLSYTKNYIGMAKTNKAERFVLFVPTETFVRDLIKLKNVPEWISKLEDNHFKIILVGKTSGRLKFRIYKNDLVNNSQIVKELFQGSYDSWMN